MAIATSTALLVAAGASAAAGVAKASAANKQQKTANRLADIAANKSAFVNQITPTGGQEVGFTNAEGEFVPRVGDVETIRTTESPFIQERREQQEALQNRLLSEVGGQQISQPTVQPTVQPRTADDIRRRIPSASGRQGLDAGLPGIRTAGSIEQGLSPFVRTEDFGSEIGRLEEATFESVAGRLRPEFQRAEEQLRQSLSDRGIPPESPAGRVELDRLQRGQGDILSQAGFQATAAGRGEQERLARLGLSTRGQQAQEGINFANLEGQTRAARFGEKETILNTALRKQLLLSQLESGQRRDQLGERAQQFRERTQQLGEIASLIDLGTPFQGALRNTGSQAGQFASSQFANQAAASTQQSSELFSLAGNLAGQTF